MAKYELDALTPDALDSQITGVMPIALPQPALPLPRPPSSGFEARGSEPGIYRPDLARAEQLVRRVSWMFLAFVVAFVALAVALR